MGRDLTTMAKITRPLFSLTAAGTVANKLTFTTLNGRTPVCNAPRARKPADPKTSQQLTTRALFRDAVAAFQADPAGARALAADAARRARLTPYQAFIGLYIATHEPMPGTQWDSGETTWDSGATTWDPI